MYKKSQFCFLKKLGMKLKLSSAPFTCSIPSIKCNIFALSLDIHIIAIEHRSDDVTFFFFFNFSVLDTMYRWSMMKNIPQPKLGGNRFMGALDMAA